MKKKKKSRKQERTSLVSQLKSEPWGGSGWRGNKISENYEKKSQIIKKKKITLWLILKYENWMHLEKGKRKAELKWQKQMYHIMEEKATRHGYKCTKNQGR